MRINGLTISPGGHEPTYHDNHFFVTFGNSSMVMFVDGHRHAVAPSPNPTSLRISLSGRVRPLPASKVAALRMSARAAIVVTGTEVLSGRVRDRNGPWLADRLSELGVDLAHVTIVGDRPGDMRAALDWCAALGVDLVITSGGLGPTADDLTATVVGEFCGREMVLDAELEERIAAIVLSLRRRWAHLSDEAIRAANRKQAIVPAGATIIEPVGTAPALVVPPAEGRDGPTVVVLPGPPRELQPMWRTATGTAAFAHAIRDATVYEQRTLRLYGLPESEIATTLRAAEGPASRSTGSRSRPACAAASSRS